METPKSVFIYSNGSQSAFDKNGEQMGELQVKGWIELLFEDWERKGVKVEDIQNIKTIVNGQERTVRPFKTDTGWNYEFI